MPKKKGSMTKAERLAALRQKLKTVDVGGGGKFFRMKDGRNVYRILPEVGEMEWFYQPVGTHPFPGGRKVYCPRFTTEGELDCPICELVQELYDAGDKASKALAGEIGVWRKFWVNAIDRDNEDAGPKILIIGSTIFNPLIGYINDPDYGDVIDVDSGTDIVINRKGKGKGTSYTTNPRRKDSPLGTDDQIDEWLEKAADLTWVEVTDDPDEDREESAGHAVYLLPYGRIVEELGLDTDDPLALFVEEDDEEEEAPRRRKKKRRPPSGTVDAVTDDSIDEEDEGDEEESDVKKAVKRRRARRQR